MAFMTVNRVHIRSVWILPVFAWVIWRIYRQAQRAPGNLGVRIFRQLTVRSHSFSAAPAVPTSVVPAFFSTLFDAVGLSGPRALRQTS